MAKIFIGIPSIRNYQPFYLSLAKFLPQVQEKHDILLAYVKDKEIADARNEIVDKFLDSGSDFLLFLDDDHEGHTLEMLEALLSLDCPVAAIKCYSRFFPHLPNLLDYSGVAMEEAKYKMKEETTGVHPCDLVGFGMTLIKREVFLMIDKPYFVAKNNAKEDNYFCDALVAKGIKPMGCFDFCLPHQGIDEAKARELKDLGMDEIKKNIQEQFPGRGAVDILVVA